ncbi:MAG: Bis(5'-nucleosyl)-tetraphosphatase [asymmetrical] (Diadenosine 5',5'''-P1,P4-tetraphosphate asymmetrical hydrolase) (Diadenosine tetraphosphatase) (Ap4A hydrolase) (Ap4Aase) (Nucleoside diphosphate-linked moiety X motif 2) (Nudix motif 2) [Parcubacteria group bacterium Gr01-1014_3]|nr:MAG: Bis(5'-nucleosyl)-tetraphosphatase [asymmetrical] (Diadenosine 5',5'''-P1,P4-tetraphosphate asymmetrical hydrolase) (Diadenosine tetraphosphatase) (Ap4A hydrolase) (Ap4Aase) (Nucleoside diphosphate-linked moiety X motif 2) (Nudix motif 2) [Parcubacteria group bacterium Gr01-1014_3]
MPKIISAGIIIFRKTPEGPKFLLLYHGHGYWNFAKGKMEMSERSWQTALREVREETGLKSSELKFIENFKTYERFFLTRGKEKVLKIVILYLAETRQPQITVSHEHEGYGWFSFNDAKKLMIKYKENIKILQNVYDFLHRGPAAPNRAPKPAPKAPTV